MKLKIFIQVAFAACLVTVACGKASKDDNGSSQPPNNNTPTNGNPTDGDGNDGQPPLPNNDDNSNDGGTSGPLNGTFYGAVVKCVKSATITNYPNLPSKYTVACSPILTGSTYKDLQSQLTQWQATNCPSPLFIDESKSMTGSDGKLYVPNFLPSSNQLTLSTSKADAEKAIKNGTCSAISGTNYGIWTQKASN